MNKQKSCRFDSSLDSAGFSHVVSKPAHNMEFIRNERKTVLQTAINFTDKKKALKIAKELVVEDSDFIEVGPLLIKAVGMKKVKKLKKSNPGKLIAVSLKPINAGKEEMKLAIDAGADIIIITQMGSLTTIRECINAAIEANIKIYMDSKCMVCQINKDLMLRYTGEEAKGEDEKNVIIGTIPQDALVVRGYELKEEGMDVVSQFKELYPHNTIVANTRTITDAEKEFSSAFAAGADIACILAITDIEEIKKAVSVAKKYKKKVMADLIGLRECIGEERLIKRAKELEKIGVDFVRYYQSENDLLHSKIVPPKSIKRISQELSIPVAVAGGVNKQSAYNISKAGVGIVIVGSEIAKSENPAEAIKKIKEKITDDMGSVIEDVLEILSSQLKEVAENIDENIIAQILDSIDKDSRIVLTGAGRSGLVARYAGAWLGKIADTRIISAGDEDIAVDFGKRKKDILFAISSSGNTYSVMEYVNTLREKGARIIGITTNAQGKAWDEKDTLLVIKGRTKDDFKSKEKDLISKRTPLGTISEFSVLVVLTSLVEAYMVGKKPSYMKKYILDISDELLRQKEIIHDQYEKIETLIDAILETRKSSKIVLQAYGRMHTIAKLFASRLYQISGTKIMIIGSSVVKRIDEKDVAVILSLSGRIKETHYATQVLNDIGIVPYFFLSGKKTLVQELINSKKATGIYVQDKEESYTEKISWFEKQFSSGKNYRYPSEFKGEILLLGFLEGIFACMYEKLCLEEKDLLHIKYLE